MRAATSADGDVHWARGAEVVEMKSERCVRLGVRLRGGTMDSEGNLLPASISKQVARYHHDRCPGVAVAYDVRAP